jgi:inhibitor of KinA
MSLFKHFEIAPLGDQGILVRWTQPPSDALLDHLLIQKAKLIAAFEIEVVHAYNELLLKVSPDIISEVSIRALLSENIKGVSRQTSHYEIPVCYDADFGVDMHAFAKAKQLTVASVIDRHTAPTYRLYFMGFLPGFLYLEGLDKSLHHPRKATPSLHMTPGTVAIGGEQTGIYPQASPGGWHSVGRTPIVMFDPMKAVPSPFMAGDLISFKQIQRAEYNQISFEIQKGSYRLKKHVLDV